MDSVIVAPGGSDATGTGTWANPFGSLPRALQGAPEGSSVRLRGGGYPRLELSGYSRTVRISAYSRREPVLIGGFGLEATQGLAFEGLGVESDVGHELDGACQDLAFRRLDCRGEKGVQWNVARTRGGSARLAWDRCVFRDAVFAAGVADQTIENGPTVLAFRGFTGGGQDRATTDVDVLGCTFWNLEGFDASQMSNGQTNAGNRQTRIRYIGNRFANVVAGRTKNHVDSVQGVGFTRDVELVGNWIKGGRGFLFQPNPTATGSNGDHEGLRVERNLFPGVRDFCISIYNAPGAVIRENYGNASNGRSSSDNADWNTGIRVNYGWPSGFTGQPTTDVDLDGNRMGAIVVTDSRVSFRPGRRNRFDIVSGYAAGASYSDDLAA